MTRLDPAMSGAEDRESVGPETPEPTNNVHQIRDPRRLARRAIERYGVPVALATAEEIISEAACIEHGRPAASAIPDTYKAKAVDGIAQARGTLAAIRSARLQRERSAARAAATPPPGWSA